MKATTTTHLCNQRAAIATLMLFAPGAFLHAGPRTSPSYNIASDNADAAGKRTTSAAYTNDGSLGAIAGTSTVAAPAETAKSGYVGQLYDVTGLTLTAATLNVNESATDQLAAWQFLDDSSFLAVSATSVTWGVVSGPVTGISVIGLAAAGIVYQNTPATVQGAFGGFTGSLNLTVLNVNLDDFHEYAADEIDDSWQVQYFGQPPNSNAGPLVDFDGTGQTNLFKYIAGLNPLDPISRFVLKIAPVPGQPGQKDLIFSPIVAGRTYTVKSKSNLGGAIWDPVSVSLPIDAGQQRTVTDTAATGARKFYRIEITTP